MKVVIQTLAALLVVQAALVHSWDTPRFATPGEYPHQVSLMWTLPPEIPLLHSCGGVILKELWVLTTGYCVSNVPALGIMYVKAGVHNISLDDEHVQTREIERMFSHEKYPGIHTLANLALYDIALIKVKQPFVFNDRVKAIQLPKSDSWFKRQVKLNYNLIVSGWGTLTYGALPEHPDIIRTVQVPVVPNKVCTDSIKNIFPNFEMNDMQMCTRPLDGSLAACIGDIGGPLIQYDGTNPPIIVGLIQWASEACTTNGLAPVYVRVSYFVRWIQSKIKDEPNEHQRYANK